MPPHVATPRFHDAGEKGATAPLHPAAAREHDGGAEIRAAGPGTIARGHGGDATDRRGGAAGHPAAARAHDAGAPDARAGAPRPGAGPPDSDAAAFGARGRGAPGTAGAPPSPGARPDPHPARGHGRATDLPDPAVAPSPAAAFASDERTDWPDPAPSLRARGGGAEAEDPFRLAAAEPALAEMALAVAEAAETVTVAAAALDVVLLEAPVLPVLDPLPAAAPARRPHEPAGRGAGAPRGPGPAERPFEPGRTHAHARAFEPGHTHAHPRPGAPRRLLRHWPLYAALDLGTNNCRLLVAEPQRHGFRVIDAFSRIVRLGEGVSSTGLLSEPAQDRAIEALRICRAKLELRGVDRARLVATEACRVAANGRDFLARVEHETGLALEIVSRETEARLAVAGCASLVDWNADGVILFDIGGGSSELVWLDLGRGERTGELTRHIRAWTSLPVGVVTLSERHGGVLVDRDVFEAMVDHVDAMLDPLDTDGALGRALASGRFHMLGTSGTVTTLAGVHLGLRRYDRRRVDGTWLGEDDVSRMIGHLIGLTYEERVANPCIGADRADLVLAGCAILEAIRRRWPCRRLRVADRGLREGILTEMMAADGVWGR